MPLERPTQKQTLQKRLFALTATLGISVVALMSMLDNLSAFALACVYDKQGVLVAGLSLGTLQVHSDKWSVDQSEFDPIGPVLMIVLALVAIVLLIGRHLARSFVHPITRLTENTRHFDPAVADLYGKPLADLLAPTFKNSYPGLQPDGLLFAPFARERGPDEVWFADSHGSTRRFLVRWVRYIGEDTALVIGVDVTEEHRFQLQFSQRLEVIGTLAGGIAHDFNNLLTPILGYTSMLLETDLPADVLSKLRAVEAAANRARDVVLQILTFSRRQQSPTTRGLMDITTVVVEATDPASLDQAAYACDQPRQEEQDQEVGGFVMLVDDEDSLLRVTNEVLTNQGYEVTTCNHPNTALQELRNNPNQFDVLVTDHNVPDMTGAELATAARRLRPDIPIILITGFESAAASDLEAIDHKLMKPISGRELAMVIQSSLATRRPAA